MSAKERFQGPAPTKTSAGKILLVDDEEGVRRLLTNTLGGLGYEVSSAVDGEEALLRARAFLPDLIILDVGLPKRNGFEVCRILKSDAATSRMAVIMLTALASEADRRRALEAGADEFLTKPFSPLALLDKVGELLSVRSHSGASPPDHPVEGPVVRHTFDHMSRQQLQNYAREMGELYRRAAALLEEFKQEKEERLQLFAVLSHELRTPLTPIMSSLSLLREVLSPDPQSTVGRLMANIQAGADTLRSRIDDLRDIAAFREGTYQLEIREVDTAGALREMAGPLGAEACRRQQQLILDIPENLPRVKMDTTRIQQVVSNLLINAMKFGPEGASIKLSAWFTDGYLHVRVTDSGKGLSREEQQRLFQPYFQTEQDRHRFLGLGLRVALCREIVEAHGGNMWVETGAELGNSFRFSLPWRRWGTE